MFERGTIHFNEVELDSFARLTVKLLIYCGWSFGSGKSDKAKFIAQIRKIKRLNKLVSEDLDRLIDQVDGRTAYQFKIYVKENYIYAA